MKRSFKLLMIPILSLTLFSCDNYLDINDSPNGLTYDQLTPELMLPGAQLSTYRVQSTTMNQLGNVFMNSWTRNVNSYGNGYDRELQLILDNTFYNGIWDGLYRNIMNFEAINTFPDDSGKYDYYKAVSKICKAHYTQYIVDLYGNAPYSQAWKGNANLTPAYDDDYAIYQSLIAELEDARDLINNADPSVAADITDKDIMLHGDLNMWIEFANTIELRMLLRMSNFTSGPVATYRDTKLADISAGPFLSDNVTINPGFTSNNDGEQNPLTNQFFYNSAGKNQSNRLFIAMTGHAWKALQSYGSTNWSNFGNNYIIDPNSNLPTLAYPNYTDPRSSRLFTGGIQNGAVGPRRAVTQGSNQTDVASNSTPLPGAPSRLGTLGHLDPYDTLGVLSGNSFGIDAYSTVDGFVMTYSEACLLQAEAALRYPSLFSNESYFFTEAVTDSMYFRVVSNAGTVASTYLSAMNSKPGYSITLGSFNEKLHAIMYQKWIALMGIHGIESYIDYTRTGYPLTPLSLNATKTRKPYRLIYPLSEYSSNSTNVPNMSDADAFTINSLTPFWVQGN